MENNLKKLFLTSLMAFSLSVSSQEKPYIIIKNEIEDKVLHIIGSKKIFLNELEYKFERIINYYENSGFPLIQVRLDNFNNKYADLIIDKGEKYIIDSLVIYGDVGINEQQLFSLININKGDDYNESKLQKINDAINRITYVNIKKEYELVFHKNTVDIYFYLENTKSNFLDGLIGLNNSGKEIKINGFGKIRLENTIKKLETINVSWIGEQDKFQQLESNIIVPNFFHKKILSELKFNSYREINNFTNIIIETSLKYKININTQIMMNYQNKRSIIEQDLIYENNFANSYERNIGIGVKHITNISEIKCNGYIGKREDVDIAKNNQILEFDIKNMIFSNNKIIFSTTTESRIAFNKNLYENELFIFGGSRNLKGFNENELRASNYSIITANLSYIFEKNFSSSVFFQQCYYEKKIINEDNISDWPKSIGVGINIKNNNQLIYLQYAIGASSSQKFNSRNAKIHIGVQSLF